MSNRDDFLDWLQKSLVDFSSGSYASGSADYAADAWFEGTGGIITLVREVDDWLDARLNQTVNLPVTGVPSFPGPPKNNAELYHGAIAAQIDALLALGGGAGADQDVADWFNGGWTSARSGPRPSTSVPLRIRDWIRKKAPRSSAGAVIGEAILTLELVEDGDAVLFIRNKLVEFKPVGLKHDLAQLIVALDAAERIKGPFGRTLVGHIQQTIIGVVQAAGHGPGDPPPIEVFTRSKESTRTG
jgi:hypothetical protein